MKELNTSVTHHHLKCLALHGIKNVVLPPFLHTALQPQLENGANPILAFKRVCSFTGKLVEARSCTGMNPWIDLVIEHIPHA